MRKIFIILFTILLFPLFTSAARTLSNSAKVSLLTYGAGNEWNSVWGHTAIWINDPERNVDLVYNYGYTDFEDPLYYMKLYKGKLDYFVAVQSYSSSISLNRYIKRDVDEQVLDLTQTEKQKLFDLLEENIKEENKNYKYEYFDNNCTTKTLEIIEKSLEGEIVYKKRAKEQTLRDIFDRQLRVQPWGRFFSNFYMTARVDKPVSAKKQMFLPKNMKNYFTSAVVVRDGESKRLVSKSKNILRFRKQRPRHFLPLMPEYLLPILLFLELVLLYFSYRRRKLLFRWYDIFWLSFACIVAFSMLFTWFGSDQISQAANNNLIWVNPLLILTLIPIKKFRRFMFKLLAVLTVLAIAFNHTLLPQVIPTFMLPLTFLLLIKYLKYGFLRKIFEG